MAAGLQHPHAIHLLAKIAIFVFPENQTSVRLYIFAYIWYGECFLLNLKFYHVALGVNVLEILNRVYRAYNTFLIFKLWLFIVHIL